MTELAAEPLGVDIGWLVAFLVGFVALASFVKRRYGLGASPRHGAKLKMVASLPLGDKRAIVLVEASEERLLVGVTSQSVQLISRLQSVRDGEAHPPEAVTTVQDASPEGAPGLFSWRRDGARFASFLRAALQRGGRG